jgi:protein required for attachment to host cells
MNAITTLVQPESASSLMQFREAPRVTQFSIAGPRPALEAELSDIIGRVVTGAVAEAQAALGRSRAADHVALEAARVALEEQVHRNDSLGAMLMQSKSLIEELRLKLQVERDNTKAATDAYETAQAARADAANEAEAIRQQLVAAYELRLHALRAELDGARAALIDSKHQYELEAAGRARAVAALKTVQQTCALFESQAQEHVVRMPAESRHEITSDIQDQRSAPDRDDCARENHETTPAVQMQNGETLAAAAAAAPGRSLKLVAPGNLALVAPPPQLAEYLRELFEQIKSTYIMDLQTHAMGVVVDRLSANVRHARDLFMQRAVIEGLTGADFFDQALAAKLNDFDATSLGRHLAIVAYELAHPDAANARVEAS